MKTKHSWRGDVDDKTSNIKTWLLAEYDDIRREIAICRRHIDTMEKRLKKLTEDSDYQQECINLNRPPRQNISARSDAVRSVNRSVNGSVNRSVSVNLTRRESDVLKLVCEGLTNRQIAQNLFLEISTINSHVAALLNKLQCKNRTELVPVAIALQLV